MIPNSMNWKGKMKHARGSYDRIQDPVGKIPGDEPVFLLRAQDKHAAETVRYWAARVEVDCGDEDLIEMARRHADLMDAWPVKKLPDASAEDRAAFRMKGNPSEGA